MADIEVNERGVDKVHQEKFWSERGRMYGQVATRCELGKVRADGDAKNGSVRVPGSSDYLSDGMEAGKKRE